jgi:sulfite exporter TauE/SafE
MAFIISTGTGNALTSTIFMAMFGLGTLPLLFAVTILGNFISVPIRNKINSFLPILIVIIGILFILRGLNLGIPYLSPKEEMIKMKMEKTIKNQEQGMNEEMIRKMEADGCCKN